MTYHHKKIVAVTNEPEAKPVGFRWVKTRPQYQVRSDAGGLSTRFDDCETLTEARKIAKQRIKAGQTTWAEVFRWAESGVSLRKFFVCEYERELSA